MVAADDARRGERKRKSSDSGEEGMGSALLPTLRRKPEVDAAIRDTLDKVLVLRFGRADDAACLHLDDIVSEPLLFPVDSTRCDCRLLWGIDWFICSCSRFLGRPWSWKIFACSNSIIYLWEAGKPSRARNEIDLQLCMSVSYNY